MAKGLTKRQEAILQFVLEYTQNEGYPPSIREIGKKFEIGSLRGVTVHLDALERKGYISRANTPRSIRVVHPSFQTSSKVVMVPLLGNIAAGDPILAQDDVEDTLPVPAEMVRNIESPFLLRVRGDSMVGEGIMPRDLVIIRPQRTANHGDLVAVRIEDEATVKRLNVDRTGTRLMPANPNYSPIEIRTEKAEIIGRVVGLLRDYEGRAF